MYTVDDIPKITNKTVLFERKMKLDKLEHLYQRDM